MKRATMLLLLAACASAPRQLPARDYLPDILAHATIAFEKPPRLVNRGNPKWDEKPGLENDVLQAIATEFAEAGFNVVGPAEPHDLAVRFTLDIQQVIALGRGNRNPSGTLSFFSADGLLAAVRQDMTGDIAPEELPGLMARALLNATASSAPVVAFFQKRKAPPPQQQSPVVEATGRMLAVLEFRNKLDNRKEIDSSYLTDSVRIASLKANLGLRVMTRENELVMLQAAGKKLDECEGECEVETGRRLGADLVVSGELLRFGSSYKLNMRLYDTHSGQLLSASLASGKGADELDAGLTRATGELLAPLK